MLKGRRIAHKAKALNHWACDGSGKDPTGTIKDCSLARTVTGLVEFARAENKSKVEARRARELESQLQRQKDADEAAAIARSEAGSASVDNEFVRVVPSGSLVQRGSARRAGTAKAQLDFLSGFSTKLDRSHCRRRNR